MPIDFEMILSASPPMFSHSAFMDFRYGSYNSHRSNNTNSLIGRNNNNSSNNNDRHMKLHNAFNSFNGGRGDIRSCLMKNEEDHRDGGKKHVWFADDKGLSLTHVKVMSEPSNCPPRWTDEFLAQVTKGVKPNPTSDVQWVPQFSQPASDYLEFRDKVQKNCVSLENVIVRDGEDCVTGTIKVRNLAFDKEVFVRVTFDKWASSQDVPATFVPSGLDAGPAQNDTFKFSISVPSSAVKFEAFEFCVCFRCAGSEYWDNNGGLNYKLVALRKKSQIAPSFNKQFDDALQVTLDSWSEFASWSHLITEGPYW